ncbi:MAG: hypothetical protein JEZ02_12255 [Desulfatibacillum sp.]|nr:hypothetical protein [Desulfatibacillum sp.]
MQRRCASVFKAVFLCLALSVSLGEWALALEQEIKIEVIDITQMINMRGISDDGTAVGFKKNSGGFIDSAADGCVSLSLAVISNTVGATSVFPMDISSNGEMVGGFYEDGLDSQSGFIYNTVSANTQAIKRDGLQTIINGMNDVGEFVGVTVSGATLISSTTVLESFWSNGSEYQNILYPGSDVSMTVAYDVNNDKVVAGHFLDDTGWHGFTYDMDLGAAGYSAPINFNAQGSPRHTFITGINSQGDLAGYYIEQGGLDGLEHVEGYKNFRPTGERRLFQGFVYDKTLNRFASVDGTYVLAHRMTDDQFTLLSSQVFGLSVRVQFTSEPAQPVQPADSPVHTGYSFAEIAAPDVISTSYLPIHMIPRAINNNGVVVGGMADPLSSTHPPKPFAWMGAGDPVLLYPECDLGVATDINDHGTVAGVIMDASFEAFVDITELPYAFSGPVTGTLNMELVPIVPFVGSDLSSNALNVLINNNDEMAANFVFGGGICWNRGTFEDSSGLMNGSFVNGNYVNYLMDINDYGQVAGAGEAMNADPDYINICTGMVWDKNCGPPRRFDSGAVISMPTGINNSGLICGNVITVADLSEDGPTWQSVEHVRPFVAEPGGISSELPLLTGYNHAMATDVNDEGEIVGFAYENYNFNNWKLIIWHRKEGVYTQEPDDLDYSLDAGYNFVPWAYSPSHLEALGQAGLAADMEANLPFVLINAFQPKINDKGQIVSLAYKDDGTSVGVVLSPLDGCVEDDFGLLDVIGQPFCTGGALDVPIQIQGAPDVVDALGFEVTFDPAILQFDSVITDVPGIDGELLASFDYWDANLVAPGVVRIGAYTIGNKIPIGAEGILAHIRFIPLAAQETQVGLQNLIDDMVDWTASPGCLTRANGDINLDGDVTPSDALCALEKASLVCDTTCSPCESTPCDVNMDCDCTAADSICMLDFYLELPSCLDDLP